MSDILATRISPARKKGLCPALLLLQDVDRLSPAAQALLSVHFADSAVNENIAVTVTRQFSSSELPKQNRQPRDLWLRLTISPVCMKALADRRSDLPAMAEAMLPTLAERLKIARLRFAEAAVECLSALHWDGNLIEMESVLAAAVLGTPANQRISADFLRKTHAGFSSSLDPEKTGFENWVDQILQSGSLQIADLEARIYRAAVTHAEGNLSAAARLLGLTRAQLAYRLDRDRTATLPITE